MATFSKKQSLTPSSQLDHIFSFTRSQTGPGSNSPVSHQWHTEIATNWVDIPQDDTWQQKLPSWHVCFLFYLYLTQLYLLP